MMYAALDRAPEDRADLARAINFQLAKLGCILRPTPHDNQSFDIVTIAEGRIVWVASTLDTIAMINHWSPEGTIQEEEDRSAP
jgi:hypothetical protein